ncbi:hypothetical protein Tco_0252253 [Tanacetum coccineum]
MTDRRRYDGGSMADQRQISGDTVDRRRQSSMHAKNLLIDKSGNRQVVEAVSKCLPETNIEPSLAFIIEPIYPIDRSTFMVSPEKKEAFLVLNLL